MSYLLPAQLVVHLDPLHLLQALLQPLVALPQLADVVARFGQDAAFTLEAQEGRCKWELLSFFSFCKDSLTLVEMLLKDYGQTF